MWFGERGVRTVDLLSTADGEGVYLGLGFVQRRMPIPMRLTLPA